MSTKKIRLKVICNLLFCFHSFSSQGQNIDSFLNAIEQTEINDSAKFAQCQNYLWNYLFSNPDTALSMANTLIKHGEVNNDLKEMTLGYRTKSIANEIKGARDTAIKYMEKSLQLAQKDRYQTGEANAYNGLGIYQYYQGNLSTALGYWQKSLAISKEIKDLESVASILMNIGNIYSDIGDLKKAINYYHKTLTLMKTIGKDDNLGACYINLSQIYQRKGNSNLDSALFYGLASIPLGKKENNLQALGMSQTIVGLAYSLIGDYANATSYFEQSIETVLKLGVKDPFASSCTELGKIYLVQGLIDQAKKYCKQGLAISGKMKSLKDSRDACQCMLDIYKTENNKDLAFFYLNRLNQINDSLNFQNTSKKLQQMEFAKHALTDSIAEAEEKRLVQEAHQEEVRKKNQTKNMFAVGGLILLILAGGLILRVRYIRISKAALQKEKDQSENLLLNILPADIAKELKEKGKADARDFDLVSIIFTDFKSFTQASEKLTAAELVNEINTCFEAFDAIMEKYGIEKIKTIGDAYMAAGGLPVPSDNSVKNTVLAALDMQAFIVDRSKRLEAQGQPNFEMRCGIHTGPVVAGIVGVKKFQYDIWGDTVNTASRMESAGEVGKVNISQATYELLKDDADFTFESRGKIEAKGKGAVQMIFVILKN